MHIKLAPSVIKALKKIKQKDKRFSEKIEKQLTLFASNPKHPSLRLHKIQTSTGETWSISITMSIRMLYTLLDEDKAYFIKIGTHEEVYKK